MKKICFIGIDGSGKTEHLLALKRELEEEGFRCKYTNLRGLYFRFFSLPLLYFSNKLYRTGDKTRYLNTRNLPVSIINIWMFFFFLDIWILAIIRGYFFNRADILLSDRGIIDSIVDLMISLEDKNLYKHRIAKVFLTLLRTDFVLLLDVDGDIAYKRRDGTEDVHSLKLRRNLYLDVSKNLGLDLINTEKSFDEVHAEIMKILKRRGLRT